jgi:DNA-binding response OmpR family regulator
MTAPTITALHVEDDARLARFLGDYLARNEVIVTLAVDGEAGLSQALRRRFDVVLLDLMLPRGDGFSVCRSLRAQSDAPVIVTTARAEEVDRVMGLELGADDYLVKPFSPRELLARIRAVVRRDRGQAGPPLRTVVTSRLTVEATRRRALLDGRELALTSYEFDLLRVLAERRGRVLSREQLLDLVKGGADETFDRSIDVHVSRLRQKLGDDPRRPGLLKTVRGFGYVLALDDD